MNSRISLGLACAALLFPVACSKGPSEAAKPAASQKTFATPEAASEALIAAAERFDVAALKAILGPEGAALVVTEDPVMDKNQSTAFAANARTKTQIVRDPKNPKVATMIIGADDYPAPIPLVQTGDVWWFDSAAGRQEILYRRIGENELDAIEVCRAYVRAQHLYASGRHSGSLVNQYAQRVIASPGKKDGLAWKDPDGSWQGPLGEGLATAIEEGYSERKSPFHGYYYKVLKSQGPAAPMGEIDFVVKGMMIGGFALVAAPSNYEVTGVKTFIVSHTGIVHEKDLGPSTLEQFRKLEKYDPDPTWSPVKEP